MKVLGSLRIWQKLSCLVALLMIPLAVVIYLLVAEKQIAIDFAQKEIYGAEFIAPMTLLQAHIAKHRGMSNVANAASKPEIQRKFTAVLDDIAETIAAIDAVNARYGEALDSGSKWQTVKQTWSSVSAESGADSFVRHTELITVIQDLTSHVGDTSNLILDPDTLETAGNDDVALLQLGLQWIKQHLFGEI